MTERDRNAARGRSRWYDRIREALLGEPASREDLLALLSDSRWQDVLDPDELMMLRNVLEVAETQARDVMVPRSQMVVLDVDEPFEQLLRTIIDSGHSRFPVMGEDPDEVVGILLAKDLLRYFAETPGSSFDIRERLRPVVFVPESKRLNTLLKEIRASRNHMAIVVDEYGGVAGLLTIEDILEEIVGDIGDEHDPSEIDPIQPISENRYEVRALTRIEDFNDYFGAALDDDEYDTVGGLVIHELGHLPRRGETVELGGFRFRVLQADRRRVHVVEVNRLAAPATD
ncbi:MAG: CBS domain-containing protein [Gammaproteobacteria bacterium]|nr:MAG: CBS domain-containing protein [Gammaproteobacteria bacterium]